MIYLKIAKEHDINYEVLDLIENSSTAYTISIQDIKDFTKRNGSVSKNLMLANTERNHQILEAIYETTTVNFEFVKKRVKAQLVKDNIVLIDNLNFVITKTNEVEKNREKIITYEARIFDELTNFFKNIDGKLLSDLDLSKYDHIYSAYNIVQSFGNDYTDGFKYLIPYSINDDKEYMTETLYPAIYTRTYWDVIHQMAGFRYEIDEIESLNFNKLIHPFTEDLKKIVEDDNYLKDFNTNVDLLGVSLSNWIKHNNKTTTSLTDTLIDDVILDQYLKWNDDKYQSPANISVNQTLTFDIQMKWSLRLRNFLINDGLPSSTVVNQGGWGGTTNFQRATKNKLTLYAQIYNYTTGEVKGEERLDPIWINNCGSNTNPNGSQKAYQKDGNQWELWSPIAIAPESSFNLCSTDDEDVFIKMAINNVSINDELGFRIVVKYKDGTQNSNQFMKAGSANMFENVQFVLECSDLNIKTSIQSETLLVGRKVPLNYFIRNNVKQTDYLDSLIKMFNLYVEVDEDDPRLLRYYTRDRYYELGKSIGDMSHLVNRSMNIITEPLPEMKEQKVIFTYSDDSSDIAVKEYKNKTDEIPSNEIIKYSNENIKGQKEVKIIFAPTFTVENRIRAFVPLYLNTKSGFKILIDSNTIQCDTYKILDNDNSGETLNYYPFMSSQDEIEDPNYSIEFGPSQYYLYSNNYTYNNLFNRYWINTINQINSSRLVSLYMRLDESFIQNIDLKNSLIIDNQLYYINRIVDYDPNNIYTKVELISVENSYENVYQQKGFPSVITSSNENDEFVIEVVDTLGNVLDQSGVYQGDTSVIIDNTEINIHNDLLTPTPAVVGSVISGTTPVTSVDVILEEFDSVFDPNPIKGDVYVSSHVSNSFVNTGYKGIVDSSNSIFTEEIKSTSINDVEIDTYILEKPIEITSDELIDNYREGVFHIVDLPHYTVHINLPTKKETYTDIRQPQAEYYDNVYRNIQYAEDDLVVFDGVLYRKNTNDPHSFINDTATTLPAEFEPVFEQYHYETKRLYLDYRYMSKEIVSISDKVNNNTLRIKDTNEFTKIDTYDWNNPRISNNTFFGEFRNMYIEDIMASNIFSGTISLVSVKGALGNTVGDFRSVVVSGNMNNNKIESLKFSNIDGDLTNNQLGIVSQLITTDDFNSNTIDFIDDLVTENCSFNRVHIIFSCDIKTMLKNDVYEMKEIIITNDFKGNIGFNYNECTAYDMNFNHIQFIDDVSATNILHNRCSGIYNAFPVGSIEKNIITGNIYNITSNVNDIKYQTDYNDVYNANTSATSTLLCNYNVDTNTCVPL